VLFFLAQQADRTFSDALDHSESAWVRLCDGQHFDPGAWDEEQIGESRFTSLILYLDHLTNQYQAHRLLVFRFQCDSTALVERSGEVLRTVLKLIEARENQRLEHRDPTFQVGQHCLPPLARLHQF
jgi:hypothetical protein